MTIAESALHGHMQLENVLDREHMDSVDLLSDTWSRIKENASQQDQSHMNIRHEILD
jgi:hypothetical protein